MNLIWIFFKKLENNTAYNSDNHLITLHKGLILLSQRLNLPIQLGIFLLLLHQHHVCGALKKSVYSFFLKVSSLVNKLGQHTKNTEKQQVKKNHIILSTFTCTFVVFAVMYQVAHLALRHVTKDSVTEHKRLFFQDVIFLKIVHQSRNILVFLNQASHRLPLCAEVHMLAKYCTSNFIQTQ